jgi:hypothetical protein
MSNRVYYLLFSSSSFINELVRKENLPENSFILARVRSINFKFADKDWIKFPLYQEETEKSFNDQIFNSSKKTYESSKGYIKLSNSLEDDVLQSFLSKDKKNLQSPTEKGKLWIGVDVSLTSIDDKGLVTYKNYTYTTDTVNIKIKEEKYMYSAQLTCDKTASICTENVTVTFSFTFLSKLPSLHSKFCIPNEIFPCTVYTTDLGNNESEHFRFDKNCKVDFDFYSLLGFDEGRTLVIEPPLGYVKGLYSWLANVKKDKLVFPLSDFKVKNHIMARDTSWMNPHTGQVFPSERLDESTTIYYYKDNENLHFMVYNWESGPYNKMRNRNLHINDREDNNIQFFIFGDKKEDVERSKRYIRY